MISEDRFKEIDALLENLDAAFDEEDIYERLPRQNDLFTLTKEEDFKRSAAVSRPEVPSLNGVSFEKRIDYFIYLLKAVNYGTANSIAYVRGHLKALNTYLKQAQFNAQNLTLVEATVGKQLDEYLTQGKKTLESKGYYDGLNYVYKALRLSKEVMAAKIDRLLKERKKH